MDFVKIPKAETTKIYKKGKMGSRMKVYEKEYDRKLQINLPVLARIDGRSFSKFTKYYEKPFDWIMHSKFCNATISLMRETGADIGYTQSDEITLMWKNDNPDKQLWFGGKLQKMVSGLASHATMVFNKSSHKNTARFDARVWQCSDVEAVNSILWRAIDCKKNAVSALAQSKFSHNDLQNKHMDDMISMLNDIGVDFHLYDDAFKFGTFIKRMTDTRKLSSEELQDLPDKHHARLNPDVEFERVKYHLLQFDYTELSHSRRMGFVYGDVKIDGVEG